MSAFQEQAYREAVAQDAAEAARRAAKEDAAERQREATKQFQDAAELERMAKRQEWEGLVLAVNLAMLREYALAEEMARTGRKPFFPLGEGMSQGLAEGTAPHLPRAEASALFEQKYRTLHLRAGHRDVPHHSALRRPTPSEATRILETWQSGTHAFTDDGRVLVRLARELAELKAWMTRLDAGDLPTPVEVAALKAA